MMHVYFMYDTINYPFQKNTLNIWLVICNFKENYYKLQLNVY